MAQDQCYFFQHAVRITKCMRECYLHQKDAGSVISIMTLERCLQARSWHDSPAVLKQIRGLGISSVRKLGVKGIKTFEKLGQIEPEQLEMWLNRSTPFGREVLSDLERIPRYELTVFKESTVTSTHLPLD
jgi:ATP-dependent DNA helicase HFM1/MER3